MAKHGTTQSLWCKLILIDTFAESI